MAAYTLTDDNGLRLDYHRHDRQGHSLQSDQTFLFQPRRQGDSSNHLVFIKRRQVFTPS